MKIRLLGTAAGGGFPQWNCQCVNCREARSGSGRARPRTQSSVAISANDRDWFLLNASPDIRFQIESFHPLHPPLDRSRGTPIQAVLLTNADLDHALGLLALREGARLKVHATESTQRSLSSSFDLAGLMNVFCGIEWMAPAKSESPLLTSTGTESGLEYRALALPGKSPRWEKSSPASVGDSIGYWIVDLRSGGRLLFMPDVEALTSEAIALMQQSDVILFDGTFWSETEMIDAGLSKTTAKQMGHMPISGEEGSLSHLAKAKTRKKIYLHINNTNPILLEGSAERQAVEEAGIVVGMDGMDFEI
jgi:pyrroloquinoline quinone biosynthesis protein B